MKISLNKGSRSLHLPCLPAVTLFGTANREEGEGRRGKGGGEEGGTIARHARPLTSLHWRGI